MQSHDVDSYYNIIYSSSWDISFLFDRRKIKKKGWKKKTKLNAELSCIGKLCEFHCLKARKGSARSERSRRSIRASSLFSSFSLSTRETTLSRIISSSSFDCHFMDDKITLSRFSRYLHFFFPFLTIKHKSFASISVNIWYTSRQSVPASDFLFFK